MFLMTRGELDSKDIAAEHALKDDLERMVAQEMAAQAVDDATRQSFEEEKRKSASTKRAAQATSINKLNTGRPSVNTANTPYVSSASIPTGANAEDVSNAFPNDGIFSRAYDDDDVGAEDNFNNMDHTFDVSLIPTLRIHKVHPKDQILGDPKSAVQTRGKIQKAYSVQQALVSYIHKQNRTNHKDHQNFLLACFLSQEEPKNISQALQDEIWVEAMQEELLQFKLQKVWVLVGLPYGKTCISLWHYEEEVYVQQPSGFVDPAHPNKVYKVIKALYGLHQAPRAWYKTFSTFLLENGFRRGTIDKTLFIKKNKSDIMLVQVQQQPDGIFISQDKYVADILKKFDFCSIRTSTTPIQSNKPLIQDKDGVDVDVHVYRSMIGSLMYLTTSRPDIMFAVCACARDSPFELEAFLDSYYGGASLDRKSTTGGCQFLGRRLISWQCKKQTIVANSTTEAEYVAAANCFKNPVYHSRTKHIEIRHHFIRDCYEKRLIDVVKIHTDNNVADLLTKGFDVTRFNFLVISIGMNNMDLRMDGSCASNFSHIWLVCLISYPTIYDSLVKQFWQTAIVRTLANGTPELVASIDNKEYTITEASVRSKLQLADAAGISNLPDAEIYDGLATLGSNSGGWDQFGSPIATALICLSSNRVYNFSKLIFDGMVHNIESNTKFLMYPRFLQMILGITTKNNGKYLAPTLTKKLFANMKRGYAGDYIPLLPAMLAGAAEDQGEGSAIPAEPQHTPIDPDTEIPQSQGPTFTHVADEATTIVRSHKVPFHEGHTSGSAKDSLQLKELMVLVPKLVTRIANLEKELHQTKTTCGKAVLTLVERVKSLEVALKRKTKKVVVSDSEDEETKNQGRKIQDIDDDPLVSLVRESMKEKDTDFVTPTKISASREVQEQDNSPTTLEAAKTLSQVISQKAKSTDKGIRYKRKTRSKSIEKDISTDLDADIEINPGSEDVNTGNEDYSTGSLGVSTGSGPISTPSVVQTINVTIPSLIKSQREGKDPMTTEEIQAIKRTKAQIQQEEDGLTEAMRLQALQEEEAARQVHLDDLLAKRILEEEELSDQQKKRKVEVQEAAQYYTEEDWDTIKAKLEANAQIVYFFKVCLISYPTIYDSLVKQFWQTAIVRTLANGTLELVASIDNKEYTITEASVRSKLQLVDAAGISNLPDAEIYDGLATLGYVSEGKLTF
ncbi:putative ribonuclease H-like domain-containing protein [Tanacetum coccineum]